MAGERTPVERWVSLATGIAAPVTVLSALLFYFGYVSSRSQYEYFGIEVDTIGLSTRDYVMRSPQPLLVPLLVLTLVAVGGLMLHIAIRGRIIADRDTPRAEQLISTVGRIRLAGAVLLAVGVLALLGYALIGDLPYYGLLTPLLIGLGAAILGYGLGLARLIRLPAGSLMPHRLVAVLLVVITTTCAFWATATMAQYSGRGLAKYDARHPNRFPVVILDTKERLYLRSPGVEESALPAGAGQTFHYRYRRLRLLVVGESRMFLVPDTWSASNTTVVVPLDGSVRVQFQFQNDPP
jgi:hypothetical protein